jgi:hypothetical protein
MSVVATSVEQSLQAENSLPETKVCELDVAGMLVQKHVLRLMWKRVRQVVGPKRFSPTNYLDISVDNTERMKIRDSHPKAGNLVTIHKR